MAKASRKHAQEETQAHLRPAALRLATARDPAAQSPALDRQALLQQTFGQADDPQRWSQRRTLAFVGLTCGGFWTCVALGVAHLLRQG